MSFAFAIGLVAALGLHAQAATVTFSTDPFAGTTALTDPGRQIVGHELFIPTFDLDNDVFAFNSAVFNVGPTLNFVTDIAANLPTGGANVIVLQTTDNDNDTGTAFGAGNAANLIAAQITTPGAGFFIYQNSILGLRRLVYSTDLDDPTADLKILARLLAPTGADSIATLPLFTAANFDLVTADATIPEPTTFALLGLGLMVGSLCRKARS